SPEPLGKKEVRNFLVYLSTEAKASWGVLNAFVAAFRVFYKVTLGQRWMIEHLPFAKESKSLPVVLSREQVLQFLEGLPNVKHRTILTTCYAAGLRISEVDRKSTRLNS